MNNVTVIGGGPVGSLLTVYLAQRGFNVNVFERRPDMRKEVISAGRSINLALSERGWRGIAAAGIEEQIRSVAIPMYGRMVHGTNSEQSFHPYGLEGQAIYSVSRRGVNIALVDCAEQYENVSYFFNKRCVSIDLDTATATFEHTKTGETTTVTSDFIIGADGAFSAVRDAMQRTTDRFNYSQTYIEHGYKELTIPASAHGGFQMEKNALHIWPRHQFMLIALPNVDGSFTCTLFFPFEGTPSFSQLTTEDSVTAFFKEYFPDALALMPTLAEEFFVNPTSSLMTVRCFPWSHKDKVLLIGDSAHGVVPFFGQGMNAGFEDCRIFAEMYDAMEESDTIESLFTLFENSRKPNADAIAQLALDNFIEMRDKVADPDFLLRKKIERVIHSVRPDDYLPLYSMVTFSHLPYSKAQEIGKKQDAMVDALITRIPNIESKLDSDELRQAIHTLFNER